MLPERGGYRWCLFQRHYGSYLANSAVPSPFGSVDLVSVTVYRIMHWGDPGADFGTAGSTASPKPCVALGYLAWHSALFTCRLWKKRLVLWPSSPSEAVEWDLDIRTMVEDLKSLGSRGAFGVVTLWNVCEIQWTDWIFGCGWAAIWNSFENAAYWFLLDLVFVSAK